MKFSDKLAKLRKQNNITQEQLADRLNISRQAVSKWELGTSIPDMEKILELCNILNCTLEDLLDDGVIKENKNNNQNNKMNFSNYFQDFLKYITNIYNMFYSMKFKQKLKCLFEMSLVFLILLVLLLVVHKVIDNIVIDNLFYIPILGSYLYMFLNNIFIIFLVIIGVIIFFHIFKIRYLDYYITIEDKTINEKIIEEEIKDEKTKKEYQEKTKKEKIIIRDPKHSTFSFFEFLSKILLFITKIFIFFILVFIIVFFIITLIILFFLIWHFKYGIIFWYLTTLVLGILLLIYIFVELFYNFLVSKKQNFKKIFILGILGLIIFSLGLSSTIVSFLNFKDDYKVNYETETFSINLNDKTIFLDDNYFNMNVNYVFNENIEDIKIEVMYPEYMDIYLNDYNNHDYKIYLFNFYENFIEIYKVIRDMFKNGSIIDLSDTSYNITIYLSDESYQKLLENKENYLKRVNTFYME